MSHTNSWSHRGLSPRPPHTELVGSREKEEREDESQKDGSVSCRSHQTPSSSAKPHGLMSVTTEQRQAEEHVSEGEGVGPGLPGSTETTRW